MDKAPDAFRTISEVADELNIPQHVLRFWESRFAQIKPMKRAGGRRYYRPEDVDLLRGIRHLLYGEGYTIRGVQRILKEQGPRAVQSVWKPGADQPEPPDASDIDEEADRADEAAAALHAQQSKGADEFEGNPDDLPAPVRGSPAVSQPVHTGLTSADTGQLASVLQELAACRQMLDEALRDEA